MLGHDQRCVRYMWLIIWRYCGRLFILTGLTASLENFIFISGIIFTVPLPLQLFRVCYILQVSTQTTVVFIIVLFNFFYYTYPRTVCCLYHERGCAPPRPTRDWEMTYYRRPLNFHLINSLHRHSFAIIIIYVIGQGAYVILDINYG
jgi:hypothetical protein